jgi:hypothetical protein
MANNANVAVELGELFDPDKQVDRWVFMLSATAADLATSERLFKNTLGDGKVPPPHRFYLQRQLMARMFEAWRVIDAYRKEAAIQAFVDQASATAEAVWLRDRFTRPEGEDESTIEKAFEITRHRTVHHAKVNSDELKATIRDAQDEATEILVYAGEKMAVIAFPESVLTRYIFGHPDDPKSKKVLAERAALIDGSLAHFADLWMKVRDAHLARKGVPLERLLRIIE